MSRSLQRLSRDDSGFGLVEAVVALFIAGIVFSALAATLISAVQASLYSRQNQQATDFMTRQLENLRAMDFGSLSHDSSVLSDGNLVSCGASKCLVVDGVPEPVVVGAGSGIGSHTQVLTGTETNATTYTVRSYITQLADQAIEQARRATVVVEWQNRGQTRTRSTSSIIAFTQRGLPLPVFRLESPTPALSVNPGARVTFTVTLVNQGAPDRFNVTATGAATPWTFYADTDGNGAFDPAVDLPLTDTSGDGTVDTNRVDPATTVRMFLTRETPPGETIGTKTTTVTATSVGQPSASGSTKTVTLTTNVVTGAVPPPPGPTPTPTPPATVEVTCPATTAETIEDKHHQYSDTAYTLASTGLGDTPLQQQMYMDLGAADESGLPRYSVDVDPATTGRIVEPIGAAAPSPATVLALTDARKYADWGLQLGTKTTFDGTPVLRLWVAGTGTSGLAVVAYEASASFSGRTALSSADVSLGALTCAGFQEVYVQLPDLAGNGGHTINANRVLGVRVVVTGSAPVRFGYDDPVLMPATFQVGAK